jgi:enoyl-CoA hydratase/carnithine racemase
MPDDTAPRSGSQRVLTGLAGGIATITLNDPSRRNSVTPELSIAVEAACQQIAADWDARVVIVTGAGPAFSAGGDLGSLTDAAQTGTAASLRTVYRGFEALAALTVPTLAAVNGPAVGAGMNFALACDVIIAAESARFDPRFLDVGIHPGGGHLWRLQARAGRQAAAALVLFGESLTGQQAAARGLAWACVPDSDLLSKARELAGRAARRSPDLVRRTKATLSASVPITNARDATDLELIAQQWSMSRPAFREGVAALQRQLAERRAGSPKFS